MKRITIVLLLVFGLSAISVFAVELENQAAPQAKNAGRQLKLTEMLRITDEEGDFYFKRPRFLRVGPDGSIYVADDKQFLKFDKEGAFVGNFHKPGEGPGEYTRLRTYRVRDDHILMVASRPNKIIKLDLAGKLLSEKRINDRRGIQRMLAIFGDKYYYFHTPFDFAKVKNGLGEDNNILHSNTFNDDETDLKLNFPLRRYLHKKTSDNAVMISFQGIGRLSFAVHDQQRAYISHGERYLIKQVDLSTGKITGQFSRKYTPVAFYPDKEEEEKEKKNPSVFKLYKPEYFADINAIDLYKDKLWVFTSTLDKEKGVLVDMFGLDGKYLDSFYLLLPGIERPDDISKNQFTIVGDHLYIIEADEDDVFSIARYKIEL